MDWRGIKLAELKKLDLMAPATVNTYMTKLTSLLNYAVSEKYAVERDKALLLLGFCGAFRRSELVSLKCRDLEFKTEGLVVTLTRSKTDQNAVGRHIAIPKGRGKVSKMNGSAYNIFLLPYLTGEPRSIKG